MPEFLTQILNLKIKPILILRNSARKIMKKICTYFIGTAILILSNLGLKAQLAGTYSVPATYTSIGSVINALNLYGISGAVTINIAAGHTETATTNGYNLANIAGSSTLNTITFKKSGAGVNPVIFAYAGGTATPVSDRQDGIWKFTGADNITIDGIDLTDANISGASTMEYGYGFFKAGSNDGCQNNTIQNCVISLKRSNNLAGAGPARAGSRGIEMVNAMAYSHTVSVIVTSAAGSNSNNRFYSNTIQNCNYGISVSGYTTVSTFSNCDSNNDIGGNLAVTGNTIINYGGGGTVEASGIYTKGQMELNISNNFIDNNTGTGAYALGPLRNIQNDVAYAANVNISNNTLSLKTGTTCYQALAIDNGAGAASATNSVTIANNLIANCTYTFYSTSLSFTCINNYGAPAYLSITGNSITGSSLPVNGGEGVLINNSGVIRNALDLSGNNLSFTLSAPGGLNGIFAGVRNLTANTSASVKINNNKFSGISLSSTYAGSTDFIYTLGTLASQEINGNTWNSISLFSQGSIRLIKNFTQTQTSLSINNNSVSGFTNTAVSGNFTCYDGSNSSPSSCNMTYTGNNFSNITSVVTGTGSFMGFNLDEGVVPFPNKQIYNNIISNINYNGTGNFSGFSINKLGLGSLNVPSAIYSNTVSNTNTKAGIFFGISLTGTTVTNMTPQIYLNNVTNISGPNSYEMIGLRMFMTGNKFSIYKNKICKLSSPYIIEGMYIIGSEINVYNNLIGDLISPQYIVGIHTSDHGLHKIYNNTIYLSGSTNDSRCVNSVYYNQADLRNNILVNKCTAPSTGSVCAYYQDSYSTYSLGSNNNIFYAGIPGPANNLAVVEPSIFYSTISLLKNGFGGSDLNSVTEDVPFASTTWSVSNYLAVNTASPTQVESGAMTVFGLADDYFGLSRNPVTPDIGAIEGTYLQASGDILSPNIITYGFSTSPCNLSSRTFTASISDLSGVATGSLSPRLYYKVNNGTYTYAAGTLATGTSTSGNWSFTLNYAASLNDVISYYLAAEDATVPVNVTTYPVVLFPGSSVTSVTNAPVPLTYTVSPTLGGTYTVGASGTFTSLTKAAEAYNTACLTGSVTFVLSDALYSSLETFPISFKQNPYASASNSLLVIPASGVNVSIEPSYVNDTAVVKLINASYITFDGLNSGGSGITIKSKPYNQMAIDVFLVGRYNTSMGNNHINFSRLNLTSYSTYSNSIGIIAAGISPLGYIISALDNDFISIKQNTFTTLSAAIVASGSSSLSLIGTNNDWDISNNQMGPLTSTVGSISQGISLAGCVNISIASNTISNVRTIPNIPEYYTTATGIALGNGVCNATLSANVLRSIKSGTNTSAYGIKIETGITASNILVKNNMVVDVGYTALSWQGPVAFDCDNTGDVRIHNNTFAMTQGTQVITINYFIQPKVMNFGSGASNIDLRNNILYNNLDNTYYHSQSHLIVTSSYSVFSFIDYNNYYINGSAYVPVSAMNGGAHSTYTEPAFTSTADPHLDPLSIQNYFLDNAGTPLNGITTDIDNQARNLLTPDVGADEFISIATCTNALGGTISSSNVNLCSNQTLTLSSDGVSGGVGTLYEWQVSATPGGAYTNVAVGSGSNTSNYNAGILPAGIYYFKLNTSCPTLSLSASSNVATVTVVAPAVLTLSASQYTLCGAGSTTLTALGATNYTWTTGNSLSSLVVSPTVATAYSVLYQNAPCPVQMSAPLVIYRADSPTVIATASQTLICGGTPATLTASGANTYSWSTGEITSLINPTTTANTTYTVTGFGPNGCSSNATVFIAVSSAPSVSVSGLSAICSGQSATLIASGATSYTWNNSSVSSSLIISPTTNTVYSVTGKNSSSCTTNISFPVTVSTPFVLSITGPSGICSGQTVSLTANGATNYTWSPGVFTPTLSDAPATTKIYSVTGQTGGCITTAIKTVSVLAAPSVTISGNTTACLGQTTTLFANGASSYTWSTGTISNSIAISPSTNTTYTVTGNNSGCSGQATIAIFTSTVPVISVSGSSFTVCPSSPVSFTASGATTYTWSNSTIGNTATVSPSSNSVYTVNGSNSAGCSSSATIEINTFTLPLIVISPSSATVCAMSPVSFSASGATTYTWNGSQSGNSVTLTPASSVVYQVSGTDAMGCTNTAFFAVTTNSLPVLAVNPPAPGVCLGSSVSFTPSGAASYTWNGSLVSTNITFLPFTNTTYSVAGTNAQGCISSKTVAVTSLSLPVISILNSTTSVCALSPVSFTAGGAASYSWSNGSAGNPLTINPASSSVYTVTGTSAGGCTSTNTIGITTMTLPVISVSPPSATICALDAVSFTASGASSYTWNGSNQAPSVTLTPASSLIYQVNGTSAQGCTNTAFVSVTTHSLPALVINPSSASVCIGSSANFTASGAASYTWNGSIVSPIVSFLPFSNSVYTVLASSAEGCIKSQTVGVTSNSVPVISLSPANATLCAFSPTTLTANGASTYSWSTGFSGNSLTVSPSATTVYSVTGISSNGCLSAPLNSTITALSLPLVNIVASSNTVCNGEAVFLTASGANSYTWNLGSSIPPVTNSLNLTLYPASNSNYSLSGTGSNGCANQAVLNVTVFSLPTVTLTGTNPVCLGQSATLTAAGSATNYAWSAGPTATSVIVVSPVNTTAYTVIATSNEGCSDFAVLNITVTPAPAVSISGNTSICPGGTASLQATGAQNYLWSNNLATASISINQSSGLTYSVVGANAAGCSGSASISLILLNAPNVTASSSTSLICEGSTVTVQGSGALSYTWPAGILNNTPFIVLTGGSYSVIGTDANGCKGTASVSISVNPAPVIIISSTTGFLCEGDSAILTANGALNFLWENSAATPSILVKPIVTTSYTLTGSDANGCSSSASYTQMAGNCTGIHEWTGDYNLNIYPNPNEGEFRVDLKNISENMFIEIYNSLGQLMLKDKITNRDPVYNLKEEAKGIYAVRIIESGRVIYKTNLIKQ